jgi:hypothetical protein
VLLKGQGLTIEKPYRTTGTLVGAGASLGALALAAVLLVKTAGWPISFPQFLAYLGAGSLVTLAGLFAFWVYGCLTLRYTLDRAGLTIIWGPIKHYIAIDRIQKLVAGRGEQRPKATGLGWWGYHIGRGHVDELGPVLFFSTHRAPEDLVYVQTAGLTYALSPQDPARFIAQTQRLQKAGTPDTRPSVQRDILASHPIWADRVAQALTLSAILLNLALWGFLFAIYPDLNNEITIEFPPIGDIATLQHRHDILKIPGTATAFLAVNILAGLGFQWSERAAGYLLLSGAVFFQALFCLAAAVAIINA